MKFRCYVGTNQRTNCLIIGYSHLISSIVDIGYYVAVAAIVSIGFQCDYNMENLTWIAQPWLSTLMMFINMGIHGFYPYPLPLHFSKLQGPIYTVGSQNISCYPGMIHVNLIDVFNTSINLIWLRYIVSYVIAVHQESPESMRIFSGLSLMKLVMQVTFLAYQPGVMEDGFDAIWIAKVFDICLAATIIVIINHYIKLLNRKNRKGDMSKVRLAQNISNSMPTDNARRSSFKEDLDEEPSEVLYEVNVRQI